jgi:hypothetical protein
MKRSRPWSQEFVAARYMEARRLLERLGENESLTLSREEVLDLVFSLTMAVRGRKGRPPDGTVVRRDLEIARRFAENAPRYREEKLRGWKGRLELDLSIEFDVDQKTIRRAVDASALADIALPNSDIK